MSVYTSGSISTVRLDSFQAVVPLSACSIAGTQQSVLKSTDLSPAGRTKQLVLSTRFLQLTRPDPNEIRIGCHIHGEKLYSAVQHRQTEAFCRP